MHTIYQNILTQFYKKTKLMTCILVINFNFKEINDWYKLCKYIYFYKITKTPFQLFLQWLKQFVLNIMHMVKLGKKNWLSVVKAHCFHDFICHSHLCHKLCVMDHVWPVARSYPEGHPTAHTYFYACLNLFVPARFSLSKIENSVVFT